MKKLTLALLFLLPTASHAGVDAALEIAGSAVGPNPTKNINAKNSLIQDEWVTLCKMKVNGKSLAAYAMLLCEGEGICKISIQSKDKEETLILPYGAKHSVSDDPPTSITLYQNNSGSTQTVVNLSGMTITGNVVIGCN